MKVSCLPVSFFPLMAGGSMDITDWARVAKKCGLDGIDLSIVNIKNHTPVYLKEIRKGIEAEGMPVIMIAAYPDFTNPDALQREREMEYLRHDIALVSQLGAKYLRILAGQAHPSVPVDEGIEWVVEFFKKADEIAGKYGVMLLYEDHSKPGAWDYVDFSLPTGIFLEIVERTRDTGIRINFDTANTLVYGDDPLPVLEKVIDRVETIHAADTAVRGKLSPVLLGTGIVRFDEIFSFLKNNGFDGWICIEEASNTGIDGIRKATGFVRERWESAGRPVDV